MPGYIRLRQISLVAPKLEPVISDIAAIMGLHVCYRDGNVAKYGLENALLPVDTILLEVVAHSLGTAAGRFLDKTGGRGGYVAIFCCDDPDERGRRAEKIGVRVAHAIDHAMVRRVIDDVGDSHAEALRMAGALVGIGAGKNRHVAAATTSLVQKTAGRGARLNRRHHFQEDGVDRQQRVFEAVFGNVAVAVADVQAHDGGDVADDGLQVRRHQTNLAQPDGGCQLSDPRRRACAFRRRPWRLPCDRRFRWSANDASPRRRSRLPATGARHC